MFTPNVSVRQTNFSKLRIQTGMSIETVASILGSSRRTIYRYENGESTPKDEDLLKMKSLINHGPSKIQKHFTFIDLFAGIGGLRLGFEPLGGSCVFTSE